MAAAPPLPRPLQIKHGADFSWGFQWKTARTDANGNLVYDDTGKPLGDIRDLSGYTTVTARMQIREGPTSGVLVDLSGSFTIDKPSGRFSLFVASETVDTWTWTSAVTDLFAVLDGAEVNLIGTTPVQLLPAVSHA